MTEDESLNETPMTLRFDPSGFLLDDGDPWTLNAQLTTSSSLKKCSKLRIFGHSAKATCLPRIEGMMKCMPKVRGSGYGMILVFVADLSLPCSSCRAQTGKTYTRIFADWKMSQTASMRW